MDARTISTFSCDIARAASRRLRSRRERLAPTASQAVSIASLQTGAASFQSRPPQSLIVTSEYVREPREVQSRDPFGRLSAGDLCHPVSPSFLTLEGVGRVPSGLINFRLRRLDEATASRRRSLIGSERRSIGRGGRLPCTRRVRSVLISAASRDTKHNSYQRNQDVPAHSASFPQAQESS